MLPRWPKPLVVFDLETTGVDVVTDRIVTMSATRIEPGNSAVTSTKWYINPGCPIPLETTEIHGITNEDVENSPLFDDLAPAIHERMTTNNPDIGGFNVRKFDIGMLWEHFHRAGYHWDLGGVRIIDAGTIYRQKERRTLEAAVRFYCGREQADSHTSDGDVKDTIDVIAGQQLLYDLSPDELAEASYYDGKIPVDLAGYFVKTGPDMCPIYSFGKHEGKPVASEPGYCHWMQKEDFPTQTKQVAMAIISGEIT